MRKSSSKRRHERAARYAKGAARPLFDSPLASVVCGRKIRYENRRAAKDFARRRGLDNQEPYTCPGCNGVHLRTKRRRGGSDV